MRGKNLKEYGIKPQGRYCSRQRCVVVLCVCMIIAAFLTYNESISLVNTMATPACSEVTTATTNAEVVTYVGKDDSLSPTLACLGRLPAWVAEGSERLAKEIQVGSLGLTDETTKHKYHLFYHRYLAPIARKTCYQDQPKKIRFLEIGLGCYPNGGMVRGTPGGSSLAWKHLFPSPQFDFELHVMEFDAPCARKWATDHIDINVYTGDASNKADLDRVYREAGSKPFDMIIDDASHINEHQIITVEHMIQYVGAGGIYVIEDIQSACKSWKANIGTGQKGAHVGGTTGCMLTKNGNPTIYAKLVEWQKPLLIQKEPFKDVTHIDINFQAAVLEKKWPSIL